jgi:DNA-directed RNA polymerase subunit RPC12/RpoP
MVSGPLRFGERRTAPTGRTLETCRLCWQRIDWSPQYLEETDLHVYYRCPHCGAAFPIRHSDAAALKAAKPSAPGAASAT